MSRKRIVEFDEGEKYEDPYRNKNKKQLKISLENSGFSFVDEEAEMDKSSDCIPQYVSSGLPEIDKDSTVEMELGVSNVSIEKISKYFGWSLNYTRMMVLTHGFGVVIPSGRKKYYYCPAYLVYRKLGVCLNE